MEIRVPGTSTVQLGLLQCPASLPALHFDMFVLLCCWEMWKRRNRLVFYGAVMSMREITNKLRNEAALWSHRLKLDDRAGNDSRSASKNVGKANVKTRIHGAEKLGKKKNQTKKKAGSNRKPSGERTTKDEAECRVAPGRRSGTWRPEVVGLGIVRRRISTAARSDAIRPIDKKVEYQIQKLTNAADVASAREKAGNAKDKGKGEHSGEEDLLKYMPNPDMMDTKSAPHGQDNDASSEIYAYYHG
ncbi:hypothetical protein U9M48_042593 [Paspalum notatum var. saurae]|uniref:Uncharacterized protein n=1 Tax=Paspalum notatum var. saurae TaxID=547442 RepID=A0AAQ3XEN0_PASNO